MKKITIYLLTILILVTSFSLTKVKAEESKVPVYIISRSGCSHCETAKEYFLKLSKKENIDLIVLEVFDSKWQYESDELKKLFTKVADYFEEDVKEVATPIIIIGDYHVVGFPKDSSILKDEVDRYREENKEDVVKEIAKELDIDINKIKKKINPDSGKYDTVILIGIFALVIGGFAGLIMMGKK